jgi:hypothetical protein
VKKGGMEEGPKADPPARAPEVAPMDAAVSGAVGFAAVVLPSPDLLTPRRMRTSMLYLYS